MNRIEFTIPVASPLLNEWQRMHWQKRRRTCIEMAWQVRAAIGQWNREPIQSCCIYIERYSTHTPDWDGLYGGLKPLLDALVKNTPRNPHGLGIIEDDSPTVVRKLIAVPMKGRRNAQKTTVRILVDDEEEGRLDVKHSDFDDDSEGE